MANTEFRRRMKKHLCDMAKMATESLNEDEGGGDSDEDENHVKYDTSKGNEIAQQVAAMSPLLAIESTDTIAVLYSRKPLEVKEAAKAEELIRRREQEFQALTVVVDPGRRSSPPRLPSSQSPFAPKNI